MHVKPVTRQTFKYANRNLVKQIRKTLLPLILISIFLFETIGNMKKMDFTGKLVNEFESPQLGQKCQEDYRFR